MTWRAAFLALMVVAAACRTGANSNLSMSDIPDDADGFDAAATNIVDLSDILSESVKFCGNTQVFNVANSYWMAVLSSLAYNDSKTVEVTVEKLAQHANLGAVRALKFFASPSGGEAVWIETDVAGFLLFRGTQGKRDFYQDIRMSKDLFIAGQPRFGRVHFGFNSSINEMWPSLEWVGRRVEEIQAERAFGFYIGGHSYGGAMATLAAARYLEEPSRSGSYAFHAKVNGLYTYGSPRVGDQAFVDKYFATAKGRSRLAKIGDAEGLHPYPIVRLRYQGDAVTRVPWRAWGYAHLGSMMYLATDGNLYSEFMHDSLRELWIPSDLLAEADTETVTSSIFAGHAHPVADHSLKNYVRLLQQQMLLAVSRSTERKLDLCDPSFFSKPAEARPEPVMIWMAVVDDSDYRVEVFHADDNKGVRFEVFNESFSPTRIDAGKHTRRIFANTSDFPHRAIEFSTPDGDFALTFDVPTDPVTGGGLSNLDGCRLDFVKDGVSHSFQLRPEGSSCVSLMVFARGDADW